LKAGSQNLCRAIRATLFFISSFLSAQTDYNKLEFSHYTTADGLPENFTSAIIQDKIGYIWVGTKNGLTRFDGYTFKNFQKNQEPLKLKSNRIIDLKNLSDSLCSIRTLKGAHVFNIYNYKARFFSVKDTTAFSLYLNSFAGFEQLEENFVSLSNAGFHEFDPQGEIVFTDTHQFPDDMGTSRRPAKNKLLKLDDERILIFSAKNGTELYTSKKKQKIKLPSKRVPDWINTFDKFSEAKTLRLKISDHEFIFLPLSKDSIYYFDASGNLLTSSPLPFIAENELLIFVDKIYKLGANEYALTSKNGGFFSFSISADKKINVHPTRFLSNINCTSLLKDREGRLWICSVNGLHKQKNVNSLIQSFKLPIEKPESELLGGMDIVGNNAFIDGLNLDYMILDLPKKEVKKKFRFFGNGSEWNSIGSTQSYYQDTLWLSTNIGILWLDMNTCNYGKVRLPKELENIPLYIGPAKSDGKAWMCSYYQLPYICYDLKKRTFTWYTDTTKVKPYFIRASGITYDSYGDVWFYGYGLSRWNNRKQAFDTLIKDFGKTGEFKQTIGGVRADAYGSLWIVVTELGLIEYNIRKREVRLHESINSVNLDYIQTISDIINDNLWLSLTNKLVCFNVKTKKGVVYSQVENLPDGVSAPNGFTYDRKNNTFYAAAGNDLMIWFKNEMPAFHKKEILVSELNYNETNSLYHPRDTIKLKHYQKSISIYFDVIDFNLRYPQSFKYCIDGDTMWRSVEQGQPVFMYNLDHGWHSVNIKFDYDNDTAVSKKLFIFIEPPFWKTTWFYILLLILASLSGYLIISGIIKRAKYKNEINLQLKEFELKALHAQMNPHFIFNSLNSIKALILYNRNSEASQYLNKFSNLVRQNLDHSRKQFLTLTQNIDYIRQYIEIEAIRFNDLNYEINISPELDTDDVKIAPMLLQPLVENAIWHGLQSAKGHKKLIIRFTANNERIICEIEDNGIGINKTLAENKKNHASIGIENIRQRIRLLNEKYGLKYALEIRDKSEKNNAESGTCVTLSFNYF